jgi:hypothetical protein
VRHLSDLALDTCGVENRWNLQEKAWHTLLQCLVADTGLFSRMKMVLGKPSEDKRLADPCPASFVHAAAPQLDIGLSPQTSCAHAMNIDLT